MKTKLILGSFLALGVSVYSQNTVWPAPGATSYVGIGTTMPSNKLEVSTNAADEGISITQTGTSGGCALNLINNTSGGHKYGLFSYGASAFAGDFGIYDFTGARFALHIKGTNGNVGMGTTTPANKLEVATTTADDGISITQTNTGGCVLNLINNTTGGHKYTLFSYGATSNAGDFGIYDFTTGKSAFHIKGANGNTGIGTITPSYKLEILANTGTEDGLKITNTTNGPSPALSLNNTTAKNFQLSSEIGGVFRIRNITNGIDGMIIDANGNVSIGSIASGAKLDVNSTNSNGGIRVIHTSSNTSYGIRTEAYGTTFSSGVAFGIKTSASLARKNYGGFFQSYGDSASGCVNGVTSYGIYAKVISDCPNDLAGFFEGNVSIYGVGYLSTTTWTSDKKLKKDIQPITKGLDKIKLLKPSTYNFRVDEFKGMNLPKEKQLGLIAQDLEEVYPELVMEVPAQDQLDEDGKVVNTLPAHKSVNYIGLIPVLISGIQEQQKTIEQQAQINTDLQKQLNEQKELINTLSQKTTGINSVGGVETGFQMSQNEPNPFSHETVVKYTLPPTTSNAFMAIYDLTGKQITTLPIDQKSSSLTITSEKLAAGIYIYSIVVDGKVMDSKRMIVADK